MTWRDAIKLVAKSVRTRETNVRNGVGSMGRPPEESRAVAMNLAWVAEELEYVATMPPHEGCRHLRKMGRS